MNYVLNLDKAVIATISAGLAVSTLGTIKADACGIGDVDFKVVKTDSLNVRTEPNTKSLVKRKLKNGDIVRPLELNESKTWARIGKNEWVSLAYLEMMHDDSKHENEVEYEKVDFTPYIVNIENLELRETPYASSMVVGKFTKGTKVFATEKCGSWIKIEDGHIEGWVVVDFLKPCSSEDTNSNTTNNNNTAEKPSTSLKEETIPTKKLKLKETINSAKIRKGPSMDADVGIRTTKNRNV